VRLARRVNHARHEVLLNGFSRINISKDGNLLASSVCLHLGHFPSEIDIDSSLLAFIKSDLVSVGELVDFLVRSPVLDPSVPSSSALKDILSQEMLVVKGVEVGSFTLVRELRGVADHVSSGVVPAVIVVLVHSFLAVNSMNEDVVLAFAVLESGKPLYVLS
jgi:hypothetical protein